MNKKLFSVLIIISLFGAAYSACDTSCESKCTTANTAGASATGTASCCNSAGTACVDCTFVTGYATTPKNIGTVNSLGGCSATACDASCAGTGVNSQINSGNALCTNGVCSNCPANQNTKKVGNIANDGCATSTCHSSCDTTKTGASGSAVVCTSGTCSNCPTGYMVMQRGGIASDGCATCDPSCASNSGTCDVTTYSSPSCSGCKAGYKSAKVGLTTTATGGTIGTMDGCKVYDTANPTTDSPSASFNVTPVAVFAATEYTSPSAFAYISSSLIYSGGFDDQNYYVWSVITSGTTYAINRRTLSANFTKSANATTDVAITTTFTSATYVDKCIGAGYLGVITRTKDYWGNAATATNPPATSEIYFQYITVNGTAFSSAKALTGNTNKNVIITPQKCWFDKAGGLFYITWIQSTRTAGTSIGVNSATATAAETWTLNGLYIQGVYTNGTLFYTNSTAGVQALALTATSSGTCTTSTGASATCASVASTTGSLAVAQSSSMPSISYQFGRQNFTNTNDTAVSFIASDNTAGTGTAYKLGSITLATGVGTVTGTLATYTAPTIAKSAATANAPYVDTSYTVGGFLGSKTTFGAFLIKTVYTVTVPASGATAETSTKVYTVMAYYNGSTTVATVALPTLASGYSWGSINGYGTSDGFVLIEDQPSTTAQGTATFPVADLWQAETYYANGTLKSTVSLGTFVDTPQWFQDTNGSIVAGWTTQDYANNQLNYIGYMGKYLQQYLAGASLTTIIGLLSFMIVALFAF